jgi:hypothetical protein
VPHHRRTFDFPAADLLPVLIDKYFEETDVLFSLLYRPAVERAVHDGLHLRDEAFACVLLMICAVGAPFVDDARVRIDGAPLSVGWRYFRQVQLVRKSLLAPPNLYDLQLYCVRSSRLVLVVRLSVAASLLASSCRGRRCRKRSGRSSGWVFEWRKTLVYTGRSCILASLTSRRSNGSERSGTDVSLPRYGWH